MTAQAQLPSEKTQVVVVCSADNNYAMALAVTARSILENLSDQFNLCLYVLEGGIQPANQHKILQSLDPDRCHVHFISLDVSEAIRDLNEAFQKIEEQRREHHLTLATYYRLLIPKLLPENIHKVIYLDCDLIVREDLGKLWEIDLQEHYLSAVQEPWDPWIKDTAIDHQALGIAADAKNFNAGVLVINLEKWRSDQISTKFVRYLKQRNYLKQTKAHLSVHDQDLLNAVFANAWYELDPRWNFSRGFFDGSCWKQTALATVVTEESFRNPYIIHFSSPAKPWNARDLPFGDEFFQYLDLTSWKGWRLTFRRRLQRRLQRNFQQAAAQLSKLFKQIYLFSSET